MNGFTNMSLRNCKGDTYSFGYLPNKRNSAIFEASMDNILDAIQEARRNDSLMSSTDSEYDSNY